jgi:hypothetical protein
MYDRCEINESKAWLECIKGDFCIIKNDRTDLFYTNRIPINDISSAVRKRQSIYLNQLIFSLQYEEIHQKLRIDHRKILRDIVSNNIKKA